jgi:hypothetical protein
MNATVNKKLKLNRETVRALQAAELRVVHGGTAPAGTIPMNRHELQGQRYSGGPPSVCLCVETDGCPCPSGSSVARLI